MTPTPFRRFDIATRYAAEVAASYARGDHDRWRRGVETSHTRAIVLMWDIWAIDVTRSSPVVMAVPGSVPSSRALVRALAIVAALDGNRRAH